MQSIPLKTRVALGIVPTHVKFVGGLVPDGEGKFPRGEDGRLVVVSEMEQVCAASPVKLTDIQLTYFAGSDPAEVDELFTSLRALGLTIHIIMMVAGANPMEPADEDAVVSLLTGGLKLAKDYGIENVSSTSIEEWMRPGETRRDGEAFTAAVAQNVKAHLRAYQESGLEGSCVKSWHVEFLRPIEFKTFTDLDRAWTFIRAANQALGKTFFKVLVDAAHCGDSGLSIPENQELIEKIAAAGEMGIFHASAKTTRGCLSTDDGWIAALLGTAASTGALEHVFVEAFHHEDPALAALREVDSRHGIDTRDGRSYQQVVVDGITDVARRLNNLVARGILKN